MHRPTSFTSFVTATFFTAVLLIVVSGCSQYVDIEPTAQDRENREAVLGYLESVNETDLLDAFESLRERPFTRVVETIQFDEDGDELARAERMLVQTVSEDGPTSFIASSSADVSFDFGSGSGFFGRAANSSEVQPFSPYAIPEDRGYNNPRHENKYVYRFGPDEMRDGRLLKTIEISVLEGAREEVFVQKMNLVIDSEAARVVSLSMEISMNSLLYSESSSLQLDGAWTNESGIQPLGFSLTSEMTSAIKDPVSVRITSSFSFPQGSI